MRRRGIDRPSRAPRARTRGARPRRALRPLGGTIAAVASLLGLASPARANFPSLYPFCTEQVQVFSSLQHGDFDYCRLHLRYVPGSADCLRIVATACNAWLPEGQTWVLRQGSDGRAERIVCPPGPPPPSCPAGYPAGSIPGRW